MNRTNKCFSKYEHADPRSKIEFVLRKEALYAELIAYNHHKLRNLQFQKCCGHIGISFDPGVMKGNQYKCFTNQLDPKEDVWIGLLTNIETNNLISLRQQTHDLEMQIIKFFLIKQIMNEQQILLHKKEQVKQLQTTLEHTCMQLVDMEIDKKKSQPLGLELDDVQQAIEVDDKKQLLIEKNVILNQVSEEISRENRCLSKPTGTLPK